MPPSRTALVHYWFLGRTGGERVCEALCRVLDQPDIFCLIADRDRSGPVIGKHLLRTSFLQHLPLSHTHYRWYAGLYPLAASRMNLSAYDLVVTSDAFVMKGVRTRPGAKHICYCHTPMRHAWHMYHQHRQDTGILHRLAFSLIMGYLRAFDRKAAAGVTAFIANSRYVQARIRRYYGRRSTVIHPPVEVERFSLNPETGNADIAEPDYYLVISRLVPYKRVDLAVRCCTELERRLLVVGTGPEATRLRKMAGPCVRFMNEMSDQDIARLYAGCRALIFPGEEDFGIVPVEAMACGRPVIAFGRGGACETVMDNRTGILFPEQSPASLAEAVRRFEADPSRFVPSEIRRHAQNFSVERFCAQMREFLAHHTEA